MLIVTILAAKMPSTLYIAGFRPLRAVILMSMTRFEGSDISFLYLPKILEMYTKITVVTVLGP